MSYLEENENPHIWKNNIVKTIVDISDIEFQRVTWSGRSTNFIFSFTEALSMLYDTYDFERYIEYYNSINGDDKVYKLLNEINMMINDFKDIGYKAENEIDGYKIILENKNWIKITEKAKEINREI
jgi:hypothetical protein